MLTDVAAQCTRLESGSEWSHVNCDCDCDVNLMKGFLNP